MPLLTGRADGQAAGVMVDGGAAAAGAGEPRQQPCEPINRRTSMTALIHRTLLGSFVRRLTLAAAIGFAFLAPAGPAAAQPTYYPTPDAAMQAFRSAVEGEGGKGLLDLFGRQYEADLIGGDPAEARQNLAALRRMAAQSMTLAPAGEDRITIVMGRRGWPMPIPLIKHEQGWTFDIKAGLQEITDRRVGRNELAAIDFCKAYIDAQRRYASADHDGDGVLEFAQRLKSTDGKQDGLFWPPATDAGASPLGPFVASAEQYLRGRKEGEPFRGYYFHILKEQGANPPGGKYSYVINGNMIAGFALIAWPADYRRSGIMTFQCGHNGPVLEKDLGPETAKVASAITVYDPDKTWAPADGD
jgi:hypothetical protein